MSNQPPKNGTARKLWDMEPDEIEDYFEGGDGR